MEEAGLRVSVFDRGAGFDPDELRFDREPSAMAWTEDGRGLQIVHNLSSEWGVERRDEGTELLVSSAATRAPPRRFAAGIRGSS